MPVCRDYYNANSDAYGYTTLLPFDTSRSATAGGSISSTAGAFQGVGITINQVVDPASYTGSLDGNTFNCGSSSGQRLVIVKFTVINPSSGDKFLLWGGRLSLPGDTNPAVDYGHSSAYYPGGSLQMRLESPAKAGGIHPAAIIQKPAITVTKIVDSGTLTPDQWLFTVTGTGFTQTKQPATGTNSVVFFGLHNGTHTVTESTQAGYGFVSGTGTNCTFSGSTASATVAAGAPPTNASCTFHNGLMPPDAGTLKVSKVVNASDSGFTTGQFELTPTCVKAGVSTTYAAKTIDYPTPGYQTWDIPFGSTCHVVETAPTNAPANYSWSTSYSANVTVAAATPNPEIVVTNTLARDTGSFTIIKTIMNRPTARPGSSPASRWAGSAP